MHAVVFILAFAKKINVRLFSYEYYNCRIIVDLPVCILYYQVPGISLDVVAGGESRRTLNTIINSERMNSYPISGFFVRIFSLGASRLTV